jgi:hypothetical protein
VIYSRTRPHHKDVIRARPLFADTQGVFIPERPAQSCFIKTLSETKRWPLAAGNFTAGFQSTPVHGHPGRAIRRQILTPNVFSNPRRF